MEYWRDYIHKRGAFCVNRIGDLPRRTDCSTRAGHMTDYAVVIAARMSSTRLPGKALVVYCPDGTTNLSQIVSRWRRHSRRSPFVVVAATDDAEDDDIELMCGALSVSCYRGSRDDVVSRMDGAIRQYAPDARFIARAMSDNPLVDVTLSDWRLDVLIET